MEDVASTVQSLKHHIIGNGGKGLLRRIDEAEQEIDHFRGNFVEKTECRRNRVEDYRNIEKEFAVLKKAIDDLGTTRKEDKKMNVMVIGILSTSLFSAASLVVALI